MFKDRRKASIPSTLCHALSSERNSHMVKGKQGLSFTNLQAFQQHSIYCLLVTGANILTPSQQNSTTNSKKKQKQKPPPS